MPASGQSPSLDFLPDCHFVFFWTKLLVQRPLNATNKNSKRASKITCLQTLKGRASGPPSWQPDCSSPPIGQKSTCPGYHCTIQKRSVYGCKRERQREGRGDERERQREREKKRGKYKKREGSRDPLIQSTVSHSCHRYCPHTSVLSAYSLF